MIIDLAFLGPFLPLPAGYIDSVAVAGAYSSARAAALVCRMSPLRLYLVQISLAALVPDRNN